MSYQQVEFARDCAAVQIPDGTAVTIRAGTPGVVTQSLGGSYTVQVPSLGGLFRVSGQDGDALGLEATDAGPSSSASESGPVTEGLVWDQLREVYDPEIPVNIVDLGLVYDMRIEPAAGGSRVSVQMTLTAPGCGMGHAISMDAQRRIERLPGVAEADVQLVWDPPWNPQMISAEGRSRLGMD